MADARAWCRHVRELILNLPYGLSGEHRAQFLPDLLGIITLAQSTEPCDLSRQVVEELNGRFPTHRAWEVCLGAFVHVLLAAEQESCSRNAPGNSPPSRRLADELPRLSNELLAVFTVLPFDNAVGSGLAERAFAVLHRRNLARAVAFARAWLRRHRLPMHEAEDAVSEAFCQFYYQGLCQRRYNPCLLLWPYFLTFVRRHAYHRARHQGTTLTDDHVPSESPFDVSDNAEEVTVILNNLPEDECLILNYVLNDHDSAEIAKALEWDISKVYRVTHQGYEHFRQLWAQRQLCQETPAWIAALAQKEMARYVISGLAPDDQAVLSPLLEGRPPKQIAKSLKRSLTTVLSKITAAVPHFAALWNRRPDKP